jgi:hypothetical protein
LKVDASFSANSGTFSWSPKLRYDDMNVSTGGIARGASIPTSINWTTVYSYNGSGYLIGLILNVDSFGGWEFSLLVDGESIFSFVSEDVTSDSVYDLDDVSNTNNAAIGVIKGAHDVFTWHGPLSTPVYYGSSVIVRVRRPTAGAKKFQAGLTILTKET